MKIADIIRENIERTLYHGTLRKFIPRIMRVGLEPTIGEFTRTAYEYDEDSEESERFTDLVFAADKNGLKSSFSAIGSWIRIKYPEVRNPYGREAISRYGALCVLKQSGDLFDHQDEDDNDGPPDWARQVEPGDYYRQYGIDVDFVLTGKRLVNLLDRLGVMDNNLDSQHEREKLIRLLIKVYGDDITAGKTTRAALIAQANEVPENQISEWIYKLSRHSKNRKRIS